MPITNNHISLICAAIRSLYDQFLRTDHELQKRKHNNPYKCIEKKTLIDKLRKKHYIMKSATSRQKSTFMVAYLVQLKKNTLIVTVSQISLAITFTCLLDKTYLSKYKAKAMYQNSTICNTLTNVL